jgi:hypothetical protein
MNLLPGIPMFGISRIGTSEAVHLSYLCLA